ncbi:MULTISPECIES: protein phosphatase 2C domain-containing protein [Actinoalloteichus]|uniref:Serine/threonine protein phosphatase n=1 Tax=Actinoalloteichus fjordicus TaxID=1612552 RepID=A0AAC9LEZ6_9PSEU|nr:MULTISPECIES: protein phosphatase 2C domain-containing protein [Actinoalloteichus]APU16698.1 serine/threonine protein phosphatase [Actinoalloteichus fjordicus]APU22764.1 serine/threonine protein phosphatase [Actinoalloteichus sp. GBA129-24]
MKSVHRAFSYSVPKNGREESENEDQVGYDEAAGRFAVADGASTAARSEVWARILVESFLSDGTDPSATNVLPLLRKRWETETAAQATSWVAQEKLRQGSAAAFVGLSLRDGGYQVIAVGDACYLHLRNNRVVRFGPVASAAEFTRFPSLVRTDGGPRSIDQRGEYRTGDRFLLVTDALAAFLMRRLERSGPKIRLPRFAKADWTGDQQAFAAIIAGYRDEGLANDDTTACVIRT